MRSGVILHFTNFGRPEVCLKCIGTRKYSSLMGSSVVEYIHLPPIVFIPCLFITFLNFERCSDSSHRTLTIACGKIGNDYCLRMCGMILFISPRSRVLKIISRQIRQVGNPAIRLVRWSAAPLPTVNSRRQ